MEETKNFRTLLGFKQEELAQLLQVSRSQLSLYEIGKRSLPIHASEKLAQLLLLTQQDSNVNKQKPSMNKHLNATLNSMLLKNQHQQLIVASKIKALQKKEIAIVASQNSVIKLLEQAKTKKEKKVIESISKPSKVNQLEFISATLIQLQIKQEVLTFEEKVIKQQLEIAVIT